MQPYNDFRYIFPPRPEIKTPVSGLPTYERMGFIGQPKLNGSCAELYFGMDRMKFMNRHQESFARNLIPEEDLLRLHRGSGPMVLCGEYMNKSKRDGNGQLFNGCLILFDILVYNGQHLTGTSFLEGGESEDEEWYYETSERDGSGFVKANIDGIDNAESWKKICDLVDIQGY